MAKYHGKKGRVMMSTSGSGTAATVIGLNMWELNMPTDKVETTEFGASNKTWVQGLPDVSGSIGGYWDDTSDDLYDGSRSTDGVKFYLYPSSDVLTKYWYGPAWVDFSLTTGVAEAVQIKGTYAANGAWGQM